MNADLDRRQRPMTSSPDNFWCLSKEALFERTQSRATGLTGAEAEERIRRFGPNRVGDQHTVHLAAKIWRRFASPCWPKRTGSAFARIRSFQFLIPQFLCGDFFNSIGHSRRYRDVRVTSAFTPRAAAKRTSREVAFVPAADMSQATSSVCAIHLTIRPGSP